MVNITTFLYFAYGSNLLMKRIHIKNPSATRAGIAKIEDHRLDFFCWSKRWQGATATIVEDNTTSVWGALWVLDKKHMKSLDKQEAVHKGTYKVYQIRVEMPNGTTADCRSYQLSNQPLKLEKGQAWPKERKPSVIYLNTIIAGAKESGLPSEYIQKLEAIPHNGYSEPISPDDNNFSCGDNEECDEGECTNDVDNSQPHCALLLLVIIYCTSIVGKMF